MILPQKTRSVGTELVMPGRGNNCKIDGLSGLDVRRLGKLSAVTNLSLIPGRETPSRGKKDEGTLRIFVQRARSTA